MANSTEILDPARLELIRTKLFTAVLGDVMDARGLTRQFLPPEIRALDPDMVIAGYAMPVLEADCCGDVESHGGRSNPFGLMLRALDELKRDEVYICTGGSPRCASTSHDGCGESGHQRSSRTNTMPPVGPGTAPVTSSRLRSTSRSSTCRPRCVMFLLPMCPAMRTPLITREGVAD